MKRQPANLKRKPTSSRPAKAGEAGSRRRPRAPSPEPARGAAPEINCAHDKLVPTAHLKPNPKNPNTHPEHQLSLYAKILNHQGWRKPIVVSNQSGLIVTGHGAWLTAKAQKWAIVPVDYQDFASPADETAHLVADNRLPQLAETDGDALVQLLETDLKDSIELAGFRLGDDDIPAAALPAPPKTVEENIAALQDIKDQRREGNAGITAKTDTEYYLVIAYATRADKEAALRRLGLPEDERYLSPDNVLLLPASKKPSKKPKASPPDKAGACG